AVLIDRGDSVAGQQLQRRASAAVLSGAQQEPQPADEATRRDGQVVFVLQDVEPQSQRGITPRRQRRFHPARIAHHVVALSAGGGFVLADVHVDRGGQVG